MPKMNNVDLMCREYKLHVRGDLSHLETELISAEHQFSASEVLLLKLTQIQPEISEVFWVLRPFGSQGASGQTGLEVKLMLGSVKEALCVLLYISAQS